MSRKVMPETSQESLRSVTEVARSIVGLSRARFYQLVKEGFFPAPLYDLRSKRPYYTTELQEVCRQVRQTNIGCNGQPILFYSPRRELGDPTLKTSKTVGKRKETPSDPVVRELTEALSNMGIRDVKEERGAELLASLYPDQQHLTMNRGLLLRELFRQLRQGRSG